MNEEDIAARKAALAQIRASFNDEFIPSYREGLRLIAPFRHEPMYQEMAAALDFMAGEINKASPAVTDAITATDELNESSAHSFPVSTSLSGTWVRWK